MSDYKVLKEAVKGAQSGDQMAFTYIYENTYPTKYYLAFKYMKNEQDAQDVLQIAYTRAFSYINTVNDPEAFSAWLSKIISNTAMNMLRQKQPVLFTDMQSETEEGEMLDLEFADVNAAHDPEAAYSQQETAEMIKELLKNLSPEQQMAIMMFYYEGLSIRDIADAMQCNENTVKSRLNLGRKKLRSSYEEMQKKGFRLYSLSPVALLVLLLSGECKACEPPFVPCDAITAMADAASNPPAAAAPKAVKPVGAAVKTGALGATGVKIGAAVAIGALAIIGAAVFFLNNDGDKDEDKPSHTRTRETEETVLAEGTESVSDETEGLENPGVSIEIPADIQEVPEETQPEEDPIDPQAVARAQAFYDFIMDEEGLMPLGTPYYSYEYNDTLYYDYISLIDFNGDGNSQIVILNNTTKTVDVYDYAEGGVIDILSVNFKNSEFNYTAAAANASTVTLLTAPDGTYRLQIYDPDEGGSHLEYAYENGSMVPTTKLTEQTEAGSWEIIGRDGGYPTGGMSLEISENNKKASQKIRFDEMVGTLAETAGIDLSNVWKIAYRRKLQELEETFYRSDYSGSQNEGSFFSYGLDDLNGDGIPELIGYFNGWDGYPSFVMTCSKYGTYSHLEMSRPVDMAEGDNIFNGEKGAFRKYFKDYDFMTDSMYLLYDSSYKIMNGTFYMVGSYEITYDRNGNMFEYWFWKADENGMPKMDSSMGDVTQQEFERLSENFAGSRNTYRLSHGADTLEGIKELIDNYEVN